MTISGSEFISDSLLVVRSIIASGTTDPISSTRSSDSSFVNTQWPTKVVEYPLITIGLNNFSTRRLGLASEQNFVTMDIGVRVWGRKERERDRLSQDVYDTLRTTQFNNGSGTIEQELFGFVVSSAVNVDEIGRGKPKSKVFSIQYQVIT